MILAILLTGLLSCGGSEVVVELDKVADRLAELEARVAAVEEAQDALEARHVRAYRSLRARRR